ncbi:putative glycosyltransferase [gamma proteobacterium HIMB55]|nr:putative glycosyltransferase [gamma proteobacterium HIMB55]
MIAGVLVSYEPEAQTLNGTFASLLPQLDHLFLVDNGSSIDPADLLDLKGEETLTIIRFDENLGIAAAQNVGVAAAREMGADFVVLSDQDTVYPQGAISQLIDVFERWPKAAAVVPLFNDVNKSSSDGFILENSYLFSPTPVAGGEHSLLQAIASGKVIRLSTLEDIGAMDEDLFIDWVDLEWCWRARHRGYQVIGSGDVEVNHSLGDVSRNIGYREVNLRSPLRHYYITRNAFALALRTPYLSIVMRCILFVRSLRYPFAFPILSPPRWRNLRAVTAGIMDALLGRRGKTNRTF